MKALQEEIDLLEKQEAEEQENTEQEEEVAVEGEEEAEEEAIEVADVSEEAEATEEVVDDAEEAERLKKQEAYKERQLKKREDQAKRQEELATQQEQALAVEPEEVSEIDQLKAIVARQDHFVQNQQREQMIKQAETELNGLEVEFKEAFTDYDDMVDEALELSKMRLVASGVPEAQAQDQLRRDKVMIADRAAAQGKDPVEAVYNEAKQILDVFDAYAEKKGYKTGKPKTNLQAMREMSKPNAVTGGRGSVATKETFDDLEELDEIQGVSFGDMLSGGM